MVCICDLAHAERIWYIIREHHETGGTCCEVITKIPNAAVVKTTLELCCDELAVLIAGKARIGVSRAALAAVCLMLFPCHRQGTRHTGRHCRHHAECVITGPHRPSEGCPCRVHDHTEFFKRLSCNDGDVVHIAIETLALALDADGIIFIIVCLNGIAFD